MTLILLAASQAFAGSPTAVQVAEVTNDVLWISHLQGEPVETVTFSLTGTLAANQATVVTSCTVSLSTLACGGGLGTAPVTFVATDDDIDAYMVDMLAMTGSELEEGSVVVTADAAKPHWFWNKCILEGDDHAECESFCLQRTGESGHTALGAIYTPFPLAGTDRCAFLQCSCGHQTMDRHPDDPCWGKSTSDCMTAPPTGGIGAGTVGGPWLDH